MNSLIKKGSLLLVAVGFCLIQAAAAEESRLDSMISPVTNPVNFEDPRITTELRPFYAYHFLNSDFITTGGSVQVWGLQARLALTEKLAFIAVKDGFMDNRYDAVLDDDSGTNNLEAGFKYALYQDDQEGRIFSVGLRYQAPTGTDDVFQGEGDGIVTPFVSGATALGGLNLLAQSQLRIAIDDEDSSFWDLSLHADYPIENFYPLVELNMYHVYDAGNRIALPGEGADVINFGASGAEGKTTVNLAVGARTRIVDNVDWGVAYEFALTDGDDVFGSRITTDIIVRFPTILL